MKLTDGILMKKVEEVKQLINVRVAAITGQLSLSQI